MSADGPLGPRPTGGLSPRARLIAGCVVAVGGGILALVALQADWHRRICTGPRTPVPGGGSIYVTQDYFGYSGVDLAPWLGTLAAIMALLPAVALMLDRRPRAALLAATALCALTLMVGVFTAGPNVPVVDPLQLRTSGVTCRSSDTAWRSIAFLGAVVALAGVALSAKPAAVVPKLGLPERPPSEVEP